MVVDPICGMKVNKKEAKRKNLTVFKEKKEYFFCSENCKEKFGIGKEKWYRSDKFEKIFPYFLGLVLIIGAIFSYLGDFMLTYMGVFFIIFSLAKMLDWKGFVEAFSNYDIISKKVRFYGWLYPALEFSLGLFYLTNNFIFSSAIVTSFIMGFGSIGIAKNLLSKNKVKCACLGTKIKVPLTKVTLLENLIMFFMALIIIFG